MRTSAYMTRKIFFALGTVCSITVYDGDAGTALTRSRERVMQIHRRLNAYDVNTEVSMINAKAGLGYVKVSEDAYRLIERSVEYSRLTGGVYDITTRPVSALWKNAITTGIMPLPYEISGKSALTDWRNILIDPELRAVMLRRYGSELDLGAIAKGYAADEVRRILAQEGVTEAVINLGGTVVSMGMSRRIGIQDPFGKTGVSFAHIDVRDKAVVTSGLYEQGVTVDGRRYHHIIDPRTGMPSDTDLAGVTLVGDSAEQLDALSTSVFILGIERSLPLLRSMGIEAIFVTVGGEVYATDGLTESYAKAG